MKFDDINIPIQKLLFEEPTYSNKIHNSKQYRIKEVISPDGTSTFYPQMKVFLFFWSNIMEDTYNEIVAEFNTLKEANDFLKLFVVGYKKEIIKIHKFIESTTPSAKDRGT